MCSYSEKRGSFFKTGKGTRTPTPKRGIMRVVREVDISSSAEERVGKGEWQEEEEEGEEEGSKQSRGHTSQRNVTREVEPTTAGELSQAGRGIEE